MKKIKDGITNLVNGLSNNRNELKNNTVDSRRLNNSELLNIYKNGLGNKIAKIKVGYSLKATSIDFDNQEDKNYYLAFLDTKVKEAFLWALVFGRGIIVLNNSNNLEEPFVLNDKEDILFNVFSGDMVSVSSVEYDLRRGSFYKPLMYNVQGVAVHHSRVIDFTYIKTTFMNAPVYAYGGISEYELIRDQILNDGIIEKASASILEKSSSFFYKIAGFKDMLAQKKENEVVSYFSKMEDLRSIYGAGILDVEDDVVSISQALSNLSEIAEISFRRLALVTGIPLPILVGENARGLNSSGDQEKTTLNEMVEILQQEYILPKLNTLLNKIGLSPVKFKENQNTTPLEKAEYESKIIDNAIKLADLGFDVTEYIQEQGIKIKEKKDFGEIFSPEDKLTEEVKSF